MRKEIEINNVKYTPAEITFNTYAEMEALGAELGNNAKNLMNIRAYVAVTMGVDANTAGEAIEKMLISGGNLGEVTDCMIEAFEESDFFQSLLGNKVQNE